MSAVIWIHGVPARSWDQVAKYLMGDVHDRSKVQVYIDGRFFDLLISPEVDARPEASS